MDAERMNSSITSANRVAEILPVDFIDTCWQRTGRSQVSPLLSKAPKPQEKLSPDTAEPVALSSKAAAS